MNDLAEWTEIHDLWLDAIESSISQLAMNDSERKRHRSNDRLWAIYEWCQGRLAKF